jgi:hypothetical protein
MRTRDYIILYFKINRKIKSLWKQKGGSDHQPPRRAVDKWGTQHRKNQASLVIKPNLRRPYLRDKTK